MKQITIPASLRFSVPDNTPQSVIDDLVQSLVSDTIPTIEDIMDVELQVKEQAREYVIETATADTIDLIDDVNVWVNQGEVRIDQI